MENLKVLIADDHQMFRKGLELSIKTINSVGKILQAENGLFVMDILSKEEVDIIFMDIKMPHQNGIETTKLVVQKYPRVKVVALSMYDDKDNILEMFKAGVNGYLLKNTNKAEIEMAINEVMMGGKYYSKEVSDVLLQRIIHAETSTYNSDTSNQLTDREKEVLKYVCAQMSTKEIADVMCLSDKTIEGHRIRLIQKTNSKNLAGLVLYAVEHGLVDKHR
ncbi:MAG: response regulator transcription factor [Bacteroidia bacterium]|nr:response regulator transcription factor [Bacteroidia bacterium]HQU99988.1 response regulator transcription factor [Bacteroidia bacterium]